MIDFLNWWVETWPRAIVGCIILCGLGALIYDVTVLITNAIKLQIVCRHEERK